MDLEVVHTKDGSRTIYSKQYTATYRSTNGAITESKHVFIEHGLNYVHQKGKNIIHVLEIGFGSGLNAMLSCEFAHKNNCLVNYKGIDKHGLSKEVVNELNYQLLFDMDHQGYIEKINHVKANELTVIGPNFQLLKQVIDLNDADMNSNYDVIYFDAFSPKYVPLMWTVEVFSKLFSLLNKEGVLVTYCAQGQFRRDLKAAGFIIEKLPGAPGKREMTRGLKY